MLNRLREPVRAQLRRLYFKMFHGGPVSERLLYAIDEPKGLRPLRIIRDRHVLRGWAVLRDQAEAPRMRIRIGRSTYPPRSIARGDVREAHPRAPPYAEFCGFDLAVRLKRGVHRVQIQVELRPGAWRPLHTSLIVSLGLRRPPPARMSYADWTALDDAWRPLERIEFQSHVETMAVRPRFEVVVRPDPAGDAAATRASLAQQIYRDFTVVSSDEARPDTSATACDYRIFLREGDRLADDALYAFADRVNADDAVDLLYGDEDLIDVAGVRQAPFFKPDWSPTYLSAANYLGRAVCFSVRSGLSDRTEREALVRAIGADASRVAHVPRVLLHRPISDAPGLLADAGRQVSADDPAVFDPASAPSVLLVLRPTGAGREISAWARESGYPALKVVIGEPGRETDVVSGAAPAWLESDGRDSDVLIMVDDDLRPASPQWIEALVAALQRPGVGAAGATLVERSTGLRHIGLANDDGEPGPVRVTATDAAPCVTREVLGVGGACLATWRRDFVSVGGLIRGLDTDLTGLDYCLKLAEQGLSTVHVASAALETPRRWKPPRPEAMIWHQQNWARATTRDPFYREDALATRPANYAVAMKVANL